MRLFGHPLHPMVVHFPVAFWTAATGAEVAALLGMETGRVLAFGANAAGLASGALAMIAGVPELLKLRGDARAMATAEKHVMLITAAWTAYLAGLLVRADGGTADWAGAACAGLGFVLLVPGGWYGGALVYRHGAGVRGDPPCREEDDARDRHA